MVTSSDSQSADFRIHSFLRGDLRESRRSLGPQALIALRGGYITNRTNVRDARPMSLFRLLAESFLDFLAWRAHTALLVTSDSRDISRSCCSGTCESLSVVVQTEDLAAPPLPHVHVCVSFSVLFATSK